MFGRLTLFWFLSPLTLCGCGPARLGQDPDILWWTDHETGSFSDWDNGGSHWATEAGSAKIVAAPNPTRSGIHSFESRVTSPGAGTQSGAQAARYYLPTDAFYSAWFYLPAAITSTTYLVLTKFRSRKDPADPATVANTWDIDIDTTSTGTMFLALYDHANANGIEDHTLTIPTNTWFQIEVHLRATTDDTGQVTVWFNGHPSFEISGRSTVPSSYLEWGVGGVAEVITPNPAAVYIDDVAISTRQLGPEFPVFARE